MVREYQQTPLIQRVVVERHLRNIVRTPILTVWIVLDSPSRVDYDGRWSVWQDEVVGEEECIEMKMRLVEGTSVERQGWAVP